MVETMNKSKYIAVAAAAAMALTMAGCGFSGGDVVEVTPTPMATPTPTVMPITATPLPTSTPAPKMIGNKTAQAKFIYLTNNLQNDIREFYLRVSGDDEGDWGNNLLSAETAFKAAEQVQMYYNGSSSDMSGQTDTENSTETSESSLKYDMKLVTADGSSYEIYSVDFGDMEKATLLLDQDGSSVYLRYMSLSTKKEADTRGNSVAHPAMMPQVTAVHPAMIHPATVVHQTMIPQVTAVIPAMILPVMMEVMIAAMMETMTTVVTTETMTTAVMMAAMTMEVMMTAMLMREATAVIMTQMNPAVLTGTINN